MSIKSVAHLAQQRIESDSGPRFRRAHFYELIAAAFGYRSYAAFTADSVLYAGATEFADQRPTRIAAAKDRCRSLGYPDPASDLIATRLCDVLAEHGLDAIRVADLVRSLRSDTHPDDSPEDDVDVDFEQTERRFPWGYGFESIGTAEILIEGLKSSADRGSALAHYALALIHGYDQYTESETEVRPHWYEQRRAGVVLKGVQIEWADAYERHLASKLAFDLHLREAARLRHPDALVDLARLFGDPTVFESDLDLSRQNPRSMAELADSLGRHADAKQWLTIAAESGDTEAMRTLIKEHDASDLQRCWTWLHLAALFGEDLTLDRHYAIHEDGSDYDDDVGGPMYVDGVDGIKLAPLPPEADGLARRAAQAIYSKVRPRL